MSAKIEIEGIEQVTLELERRYRDAHADFDALNSTIAFEIERGVKRRIQRGPKTGIVYRRGNIEHRASKPGEAPATDRGSLVSSIYVASESRYSVTVGSRLAYAYWLEFGTKRIEPRPAWIPEIEKARPKYNKMARAILRRRYGA